MAILGKLTFNNKLKQCKSGLPVCKIAEQFQSVLIVPLPTTKTFVMHCGAVIGKTLS